jgi:esterase/lipase
MSDEPDFMPVHHPCARYRGCDIKPLAASLRKNGFGWSCQIPGLPGGGWAETTDECKRQIDRWLALIDAGKESDHAD